MSKDLLNKIFCGVTSTRVASSLARKYQTRVEMGRSYKRTSFQSYTINNYRKKFYSEGPLAF
jgi:hypothetical protein